MAGSKPPRQRTCAALSSCAAPCSAQSPNMSSMAARYFLCRAGRMALQGGGQMPRRSGSNHAQQAQRDSQHAAAVGTPSNKAGRASHLLAAMQLMLATRSIMAGRLRRMHTPRATPTCQQGSRACPITKADSAQQVEPGHCNTASPAAHAPHLAVSGDQALAHHKVQDLAQQALGVVVGVVEQDLRVRKGAVQGHGWQADSRCCAGWQADCRCCVAGKQACGAVLVSGSVGRSASARQAHGVVSWVRQPTTSRRHAREHQAGALTCFAISGSETMTNCLGPKASLKILP